MVKLALVFILLFVFYGSCFAYNLYVDSEADTLGAVGSQDHPYIFIQDAIDHAFNDADSVNQVLPHPSVEIHIVPSMNGYHEQLLIDYCNTNNQNHHVQDICFLTEPGYSTQSRIVSLTTELNAIMVDGSDTGILRFKNIQVSRISELNESRAIIIDSNTSLALRTLEIVDCTFDKHYVAVESNGEIENLIVISSTITSNLGDYEDGPFGIRVNGNADPNSHAVISDNLVSITFPTQFHTPSGVALQMGNYTQVDITNNLFINASLEYTSSLLTAHIENVLISSNEFRNSSIRYYGLISSVTSKNTFTYNTSNSPAADYAIVLNNTTPDGVANHCIDNNLFFNTPTPLWMSRYTTNDLGQEIVAELANNSFFDCGQIARIAHHLDGTIATNRISYYQNNLYTGTVDSLFTVFDSAGQPAQLTGDYRIPVSYSHFNTALSNSQSMIISNITSGDPYIDLDYVTHTYTLLWDGMVRSMLINTGSPIANGIQTDPDGTPPDIGAVYYPHIHQEYVFPSFWPTGGKIKWMSFPVLDDRTCEQGEHWNEMGYLFEEHMLNTPDDNQLVSASWSYDNYTGEMSYLNGDWLLSDYHATQPKGFKLEFNQNVTTIDPVTVNGFKADAATTPVELFNGTNNDFDNWIGYFVPYTQGAKDAFSQYLPGSTREKYIDYIYSIKTQTWGTRRMFPVAGSPWIIDPNRYTFSEGDMASIFLLPRAPGEMYWQSISTPEVPRTREMAANFSYTEELDYIPIFIEFDPNDLPDEVGLMVAGECKGAAVVDSNLIEVNYYASSAAKGDDEIEVMFYYGGKGTKKAPDTKVYNPDTMLFEDGKLKASQLGDYGYISFNRSEGSTLVPLVTELKQNYPNPFKGLTNISWVLEKDEPISVDIYNLKGQKVKSFYSGLGKKGRQVLSWDAKDNNGQSVASGIYFYRLNTPEGSKVQKMMVVR